MRMVIFNISNPQAVLLFQYEGELPSGWLYPQVTVREDYHAGSPAEGSEQGENSETRKEFRTKLNGDESRKDASASFTLPFDTRDVWGRAKVAVKVTINGCTWRGKVGDQGGRQYIVVNAEARRNAGVKAGDLVTITLEPDAESREIEIPLPLQRALGTKLTQKVNRLSFTHKKEFIVWYSEKRKTNGSSSREDEADALGGKGH